MIGTEASEERAGGEVEELWRGIYKSEYRPTLKNGSAHARIFRPSSSVLKLNIHKVIRFSIGKSNFIAVNIGSGLGPVDKSTKSFQNSIFTTLESSWILGNLLTPSRV